MHTRIAGGCLYHASVALGKPINLIVCSAIALLIAIVAPFINSAIPNPLLFIKKYHFYQVSGEHGISGYILITRKKYRSKQELKTVNRMFDFLLLDAERK